MPQWVVDVDDARVVSVGQGHACAVDGAGSLSCWGSNSNGQLGNSAIGTNAPSPTPAELPGIALDDTIVGIGAGALFSAALLDDPSTGIGLWTWGYNGDGQLGIGTIDMTSNATPFPNGYGGLMIELAVGGGEHACVRLQDASVACWGRNDDGQVGDGSTTPSPTPTLAASVP